MKIKQIIIWLVLIAGLILFINYATSTDLISKTGNYLKQLNPINKNIIDLDSRGSCLKVKMGAGLMGIDKSDAYQLSCIYECENHQGSPFEYYSYFCSGDKLICRCKVPK